MDVRLVFPEHGQVELQPHCAPDPGPGQVRVASTLSLMSTGTENIVFNGDFAPGTHFACYGTLPFFPGYLTVGVVDAVGHGVLDITEGNRVFHRAGHGSRFTLPTPAVATIPNGVSDEEAVWAGLAKVAFRAAHAAPFRLAERLAIVGSGPVGQMAVRWAAAAGCEAIVVVGRSPRRLEFAVRGGATHVIQAPVEEATAMVADALGGEPQLVVDTTGNAEAFDGVLALAGRLATVLILGDTGHPGAQCLSSHVMTKGLTITAVHDSHDKHGGDESRVVRFVLDLMARGRFDCTGLITHNFAPECARDAYRLANDQRAETVGISFTWRTFSQLNCCPES
jgi:2-desacetyl-2-hydroxyethyl bacteriochlorophyllide A dehydrogenase